MDDQIRVHELARELGVESRAVLDRLTQMGESPKSAASIVAPATASLLRHQLAGVDDDDGRRREALCIGLTAFKSRRGLPFVARRTDALIAELDRMGYRCRRTADPLPAEGIGAAVREAIARVGPDDVLIVHVLSHGHVTPSGTLHIVGGDGVHHELTDVERWLKNIVDASPAAPRTLFLLDICNAGNAARLTWQVDVSHRAWVIAACAPDENAYNGRFTEAVTNVLRDLADGKLDIDRSLRHVPLATVAQKIRRDVSRLSSVAQAMPQQVTASLVDISADPLDLPFFPNPRYVENPRRLVRPRVDAGVTPFLDDLDEALDPRHFVQRALGRQGSAPDDASGCFSGRSRELKILAPWLNLQDEVGLRVVTGSPGVGKSALLGVLVCAAHPLLREPTRSVWEHIEQVPYVNRSLAAVHARGRTVTDIASSLARQLGLDGPLVAAAASLPAPPVIVLDALDEASNPVAVLNELLIPLARIRFGAEPLRLLVGMRPWEQFAPLRELAGDGLLDLDAVPTERLRRDLQQYVSRLLLCDPRWDRIDTEGSAHTLARAVAEQLTSSRTAPEWGAFLVAGLYTHHVLNAYPEAITDPASAARRGNRVPLTLPDVLELDLATRGEKPWLRPVLAALAHAHGEGMPASLIRYVAGAPAIEEVLSTLDDVRFYLRHSTETDGTTLYRLFHQGLTDHLRKTKDPREVSESLKMSLRPNPNDALHWHLAEPYLLRHALDHSLKLDPGLLVEADPSVVMRQITVRWHRIYSTSHGDSRTRRQILAVSASYFGDTALAEALISLPGLPPLDTIPLWTEQDVDGSPITAINTFTVDRTSWAILGSKAGEVRVRQIQGAAMSNVDSPGIRAPVTAVAGADGMIAIGFHTGDLIVNGTRMDSLPARTLQFGQIGATPVLLMNGGMLLDLAAMRWISLNSALVSADPTGHPYFALPIDQVCRTPLGETVIRSGGKAIALKDGPLAGEAGR